mgnify:CR=1 FL=1
MVRCCMMIDVSKLKKKKLSKETEGSMTFKDVCVCDDDDDDGITKSIYLWMSFIHLYFM